MYIDASTTKRRDHVDVDVREFHLFVECRPTEPVQLGQIRGLGSMRSGGFSLETHYRCDAFRLYNEGEEMQKSI